MTKTGILMATVSIVIGFALSPVQAQPVNGNGSNGSTYQGPGLPPPSPPEWMTNPGQAKANGATDC